MAVRDNGRLIASSLETISAARFTGYALVIRSPSTKVLGYFHSSALRTV
jgi:hypothetical protein